MLPAIAKCTNDDDRLVRVAAARLLPDLKTEQFKQVADMARKLSWRAALSTTLGYIWRTQAADQPYNAYAVDLGRRILEGKHSFELKLEAVRVLQLALGDVGDDEAGPVFESYAPGADLEPHERDLDPLRISLAKIFPTDNPHLDLELGRLVAMISPANDELLTKIISKITPDSTPVDDIHYLIVAARLPATLGAAETGRKIAAGLQAQSRSRNSLPREMQKDVANWNSRVSALYSGCIAGHTRPGVAGNHCLRPVFRTSGACCFSWPN